MLIRTLAGAEDVVNAGAVDKYLSGDDVNAAKSQKGIDSASGRGLAGHHEKVETRGVRGLYGSLSSRSEKNDDGHGPLRCAPYSLYPNASVARRAAAWVRLMPFSRRLVRRQVPW